MKKLSIGMRLKLVRGSNGQGYGCWYAGRVPVGTKGTVYARKDGGGCPAIKFDGIEPNNGMFFGLASDSLENDHCELFEECE